MMLEGKELRELRQALGLRQAGLAAALGLTPQFIGLMERGLAPVEPRTEMATRYLVDHPEALEDLDVEYDGRSATSLNRVVDGREWGLWRVDRQSLTLDFDSRMVMTGRDDWGEPIFERLERYYVSLTDMTSPPRVVDWIGQIAGKPWGYVQLGHFVSALDEIFDLQGAFVHQRGFASREECAAFLKERIGSAESGE
jgi:transcriptional regulator with XRE-family HTH domain